jgi:hypothetical protein
MGKTLLRFAIGLGLLMSPFVLMAQQGSSDTSQAGNSSKHSQTVTATGCLEKGQEAGGYYLKDENGKDWELTGKDLASHVGHEITVTGHEVQGSKAHEAKAEPNETTEAGGKQYADLQVTHVKMVSESCQ